MATLIAAVVQTAASLVLAWLTWQYVRLTRDLSETAQRQTDVAVEQLQIARDAYADRIRADERARGQRFEDRAALLQQLHNMLSDIGGREFWGTRVQSEPVWEDQDVDQLIVLSADRPAPERRTVTTLAVHLRWLRGEVMKLRSKAEGAGHDAGQAWQNHADTALRLFDQLQQVTP